MPELPEPRVKACFDDGPYAGESIQVPWARLQIPMMTWRGQVPVECMYRLVPPWRGQDVAHYRLESKTKQEAA